MDQRDKEAVRRRIDLDAIESELSELPELLDLWDELDRTERFVAWTEWGDLVYGRWKTLANARGSMSAGDRARFEALEAELIEALPDLQRIGVVSDVQKVIEEFVPVHA